MNTYEIVLASSIPTALSTISRGATNNKFIGAAAALSPLAVEVPIAITALQNGDTGTLAMVAIPAASAVISAVGTLTDSNIIEGVIISTWRKVWHNGQARWAREVDSEDYTDYSDDGADGPGKIGGYRP